MMGWSNPDELVLPLTATFVVTSILAGLLRTLLLWALTKFALMTCADISSEIYLRTLYQDYEVHITRNSSQIINGVLSQTNSVTYEIILPLMSLISSVIMCSIILSVMIFLDPKIALSATLGFGLIYLLVIVVTKNHLSKNGETLARESTQMIKSVQEGLGGIRDVLLDGSQGVHWEIYQKANIRLRRVQASIAFISSSPRFMVESFGMVVIALLTYGFSMSSNEGVISILPFLGALAVGAQRLLPLFQQIYVSTTNIRAGQQTLKHILYLLEQPLTLKTHMDNSGLTLLSFNRDFILKNVSFQYSPNSPLVLRNIDLKIKRRERIGFIGKTGSGKSTLIDLIMGLLVPTEGGLVVDGQLIDAKNHYLR
jgi:ATP-binding cassette subfamily B protein